MTFIAMLRGINVGGKKSIKMDRLRQLFEDLDFKNVRTYVQSGNIVFQAPKAAPAMLAKRIETAIMEVFGFHVPVILRTSEELAKVIDANPFLDEKDTDLSTLYVTFLLKMPTAAGLKRLEAVPAGTDRFRVSGAEVYLECPNGYGRTKLSNNAVERLLETGATTRNWKTITQLHEMSVGS